MNKLTRNVVMTGVAIAAGLTMAAGPAAASPATPSTSQAKPAAADTQQLQDRRRDRIVGFYRNPRMCHRIGRAGVWDDEWEDYECFRVWRGFHRGSWALKVYYGWGGPGGPGWNRN